MSTTTDTLGTVYVETAGCNVTIDGYGTGVTTAFKYGPGLDKPTARQAFVRLDDGRMLIVELDGWVKPCDCFAQVNSDLEHNPQCRTQSSRDTHKAAISARVIDRDEFDAIHDIPSIRTALGWRG